MPTLQFKGKNIIWNHHLSIPYHTLEEDKKLSFQPEKGEGNLIIEGDNLIALKALVPQYTGRIKCIYIDPPYNTGKIGQEWFYNDKVNSPLIKEWFGKEVTADDLTKHDKWLCMMAPRLKLLHNLLSENGIIFISIDDNELYNLRLLMNEIFGEENYVTTLPTIMNLKGNQDEFGFAGTHEYTIVWTKEKNKSIFFEYDAVDEDIEGWQNDEVGLYKEGAPLKSTGSESKREHRRLMFYPILVNKKDNSVSTISKQEYAKIYDKTTDSFNDGYLKKLSIKYEKEGYYVVLPYTVNKEYGRWRWGFSEENKLKLRTDVIVKIKDGEISLYKKQRPELSDLITKKPKSVFYKPEYSSGNGTNLLKSLLGDKLFNNPKPLELIKDLLILSSKEKDIILDSFAGSGTTGHAVMDLAKLDKGERKYILIQMTEATNDNPNKNICKDVTRQRLKRAIEVNGYDSGFQYLSVGKPIDAETILNGELPKYYEFAKYIFYLCTGDNLSELKKIKGKDYYVGEFGNQVIYLIYKEDFNSLTKMALTLELAEKFISANPNKRIIVYAPACFVDQEYLNENQIEFVSIPYNLFQRNK